MYRLTGRYASVYVWFGENSKGDANRMCFSSHWMADFALQGAQQSLYDYTAGAAGGKDFASGIGRIYFAKTNHLFVFLGFLGVKTE